MKILEIYPSAGIGGIETYLRKIKQYTRGHQITLYNEETSIAFKLPIFNMLYVMPLLPLDLLTLDYDVASVHGYGTIQSITVPLIAKLLGKKVLWTVHGIPDRKLLFIYDVLALIPEVLADKIIVVSDTILEERPELDLWKTEVIPCGVDFKNMKNFGKDYIFIPTRYNKEGSKNAREAIKALRYVPYSPFNLRHEHMNESYSNSILSICPSKKEGFCLSFFESWACGTPALMCHTGASYMVREICPRYIMEGNEIHTIVANIVDVMYDENRKTVIKKMQAWIKKNLNWEKICKDRIKLMGDE